MINIAGIFLRTIGSALRGASPEVADQLKRYILELEKKAVATPNPYDNILVDFMKALFGIDEK